jgi:hypothetical protein
MTPTTEDEPFGFWYATRLWVIILLVTVNPAFSGEYWLDEPYSQRQLYVPPA